MSTEFQGSNSLVRASEYGLGTTDFIVRYGLLWGREDIGREVILSREVVFAMAAANKQLTQVSKRMIEQFGSFTEPLAIIAMAGVRTAEQQATLTRLGKTPHVNREVELFYDVSVEELARQQLWANVRIADCVRENWHTRTNVVDIGVIGADSNKWMDTSLCYSASSNLLLKSELQQSRSLAAGHLAAWVLHENGFRHNPHKNHWHWRLETT